MYSDKSFSDDSSSGLDLKEQAGHSDSKEAMLPCDSRAEPGDSPAAALEEETGESRGANGGVIPSLGPHGQPGNQGHSEQRPLSGNVKFFVYLSHTLSAWSDRMWAFGVGLFMVVISPDSLRLTAIYGFSSGSAILLLCPVVGDWVDNTRRLTAARVTLIVQNLTVVLSAGVVYVVIVFKAEIQAYWPDDALLTVLYGVIIAMTTVSNLASIGSTIAVERDWIVEICGKDGDLLASMSATLRRIDQLALILAPAATGQIMTYTSTEIGAIFIAGWNLVSVFVEYYLLWKVYDMVPALKKKQYQKRVDDRAESAPVLDASVKRYDSVSLTESLVRSIPNESQKEHVTSKRTSCCGSCLLKTFSGILILVRGFRTYMRYDVALAGLGLSFLFMTVLGFDNVTVGFAYTQGLTESMLGILMAAGALFGILGTFVYPTIRRRLGLPRTGLVGLFLQVSCLSMCVASVWAPGSPFDPLNWKSVTPPIVCRSTDNTTVVNTTMDSTSLFVSRNNTSTCEEGNTSEPDSYVSIAILMAGIVSARCGLWLTDLAITQMFVETVQESERGIVNGVQNSLNQLMDMLKFAMVIVAPETEVFGALILVSFGFVCLGWLCYVLYSRKVRGHLFHFEKLYTCVKRDNNNTIVRYVSIE